MRRTFATVLIGLLLVGCATEPEVKTNYVYVPADPTPTTSERMQMLSGMVDDVNDLLQSKMNGTNKEISVALHTAAYTYIRISYELMETGERQYEDASVHAIDAAFAYANAPRAFDFNDPVTGFDQLDVATKYIEDLVYAVNPTGEGL